MGKTFSTGLLTNGIWQDASNNIGIGAAPSGSYKLEVTGTAKVSSTLLVSGAATFSSTITQGAIAAPSYGGGGSGINLGYLILQNTIATQASYANNVFYNGTNWKSITSTISYAQAVRLQNGNIDFHNALVSTSDQTMSNWDTTDVKMRITIGGNVGIGTISPKTYASLTTNGQLISLNNIGIDVGQSYRFNNYYNSGTGTDRTISTGFGGSIGYENSTGSMTFNTSASTAAADNNVSLTERMRISSAGLVTVTGSGLAGNAEGIYFKRVSSLDQGGIISGSGGALVLTATNAYSGLYGTTVFQRYNGTGFAESLRITSDGYFCVATSTVVSPGGVSGVSNMVNPLNDGAWALALQNSGTSAGHGRGIGIRNVTDYNTTNSEFIFCVGNTTPRFIVESNGGIYNYSANNSNLSDIRTKKDIVLLESYWDKFKAIEIVKFKYKDQTHDDYNIGVIAQQILEIAPEFVNEEGFGGEDNIPEDGMPLKSIYTEDLHNATIKVLQEAMAKIEKLEERLNKAGL